MESRITSYLDSALRHLADDFLFEVRGLLDRLLGLYDALSSFVDDLTSSIRSELKLRVDPIEAPPIDVRLTFPDIESRSYGPLAAVISEVSARLSVLPREMDRRREEIPGAIGVREPRPPKRRPDLGSEAARLEARCSFLVSEKARIDRAMGKLHNRLGHFQSGAEDDFDFIEDCRVEFSAFRRVLAVRNSERQLLTKLERIVGEVHNTRICRREVIAKITDLTAHLGSRPSTYFPGTPPPSRNRKFHSPMQRGAVDEEMEIAHLPLTLGPGSERRRHC
jgi:hypothetical protein